MALEVYQYTRCGTCRKAIRFLDDLGIEYESRDITETPPSAPELRRMLEHFNGDIGKRFNTSGQLYRNLNMKDKLATMTADENHRSAVAERDAGQAPFSAAGGRGSRRIQGRRLAQRTGLTRGGTKFRHSSTGVVPRLLQIFCWLGLFTKTSDCIEL